MWGANWPLWLEKRDVIDTGSPFRCLDFIFDNDFAYDLGVAL